MNYHYSKQTRALEGRISKPGHEFDAMHVNHGQKDCELGMVIFQSNHQKKHNAKVLTSKHFHG